MDKDRLKQLKYLESEIETIKKQIEKLECVCVSDIVKGSSSQFPYVERSFQVEGLDTETYNNKFKRLQKRLERKIDEFMDAVEEMNEFIDKIDDSLIRQVISLKYINGLTWEQVALSVGEGYTSDSVRMISNRFLERC